MEEFQPLIGRVEGETSEPQLVICVIFIVAHLVQTSSDPLIRFGQRQSAGNAGLLLNIVIAVTQRVYG